MEKSQHHFVFQSWEYDAERPEGGEFQPKSDYSTVKFTKGATPETNNPHIGASEYHVLFEETYHAWKFYKNGCKQEPQTCSTEAEAWKFSTKAPGTIKYTNTPNGLEQTIMGRISNASLEQVAKGLHDGFVAQPCTTGTTGFGRAGMKAKYPHLPLK